MKQAVYVDTAWLVALIDVRDQHHEEALALAEKLAAEDAPLVSTDAVARRTVQLVRAQSPPGGGHCLGTGGPRGLRLGDRLG